MITVTAPTGHIGSRVLTNLLAHGEEVRVIVRDPARLPPDVRGRIEIVEGSHRDADKVREGVDGAHAVFFFVAADPKATGAMAAYVDFTRGGAEVFTEHPELRVVGVTALGRGTPVQQQAGYVTGSLAMDDLIAGTGVNYRTIACPSLMDNVERQVVGIRERGVWFDLLDPDTKNPMIATRDVADAAVPLLVDRGWTGCAEVPVLGPEDLSPNEMAAIAADVLDRPVRYERTTPDAQRRQLRDFGFTPGMAAALVDMMVAKNNGLDQGVERTPATTTPTTFRQWCHESLKPQVDG